MLFVEEKPERLIREDGTRLDGRKPNELRPIRIEVGVLSRADGSCYIEWGKNKILVAVYGPRELHPKHQALPDRAKLRVRYSMAPFSTLERKKPGPDRRTIELSKVIRHALEPALFLEYYPKTAIDVFIEVLQSDAGTRCAGITAASLALADAGIPMRDLVASCSVGKVDGVIVLDIMHEEDLWGEADMPVALMPRKGKVTLLQMDGIFTPDEFKKAFELALDGCRRVYELQKKALMERFVSIKREIEEGE